MSYEINPVALASTFDHYISDRKLPKTLFSYPDHISFQAADIKNFKQIVSNVDPYADQITVTQSEERFLAVAKLTASIGIPKLGSVHWLEIAEPTLDEVWITGINGDILSFYYQDINEASGILGARGVRHTMLKEPAPAILAPFAETGISGYFKLSKIALGALVEEQIDRDQVIFAKRAA